MSLTSATGNAIIYSLYPTTAVAIFCPNAYTGYGVFSPASYSVYKSLGGSVTLNVQRQGDTTSRLSAYYYTSDGSAYAQTDYTGVTASWLWAAGDSSAKQITIPIAQSAVNTGPKTFTVTVVSYGVTSTIQTATVNILDLPYEQWVRKWWAGALPTPQPPLSGGQPSASLFAKFSLSETTGTTAAGANASGATVSSGNYTRSGAGSFVLGQPGPQPPKFAGFSATNTCAAFNANGSGLTLTIPGISSVYAYNSFLNGGYLNAGTLNGLNSLTKGFTVTAWVKTTTNNIIMALMGSNNITTAFQVFLNENEFGQVAPDNILFVLRADNGDQLSDSVPLSGLPTGKLTDGNWHQLAIVVPSPGPGVYANFYFDGSPVGVLNEYGNDGLQKSDTFVNVFNPQLDIGASSEWARGVDSFFNGSIDEVVFYTTSLSSAGIASLYLSAVSAPVSTADPAASAPSVVNGSGVANLLAYAIGLSPFASAQPYLPTATIENDYLNLNFPRLRSATDITYHVQASPDLQNWSEIWNSTGYQPGGTDQNLLLQVPDTVTVSSTNRRFLRLQITHP